jgi:hypothetical protein
LKLWAKVLAISGSPEGGLSSREMIDDKGVLERLWPPQPFSLLSAVGSLHPSCLTLPCLVLATGGCSCGEA